MKLGRLPREYHPGVKTLRALYGSATLPTAPESTDWTKGIKSFGMMLNDRLGDCTCAALFHLRQLWTANTGMENTQPDIQVLKLYEAACGYKLNDPSTDMGGSEQSVLRYCLNKGIPLADGTSDKILGFVEVNQTNLNDVKLAIAEFGGAYIGVDLPASVFSPSGVPEEVWTYVLGSRIRGGHAVAVAGYNSEGLIIISWGQLYQMTWSFFSRYCDEIYAIVDRSWVTAQGKTPLNISLTDLETLMVELKDQIA